MKRKRPSGIVGRWSAVMVLGAAGGLALGGVASAGTTPTPSTSPSPNPSASTGLSAAAADQQITAQAEKNGVTCTVTSTGQLTDCGKAVGKSKLPAGATNTSNVASPVSDIASIVDTRTWTTGGGNTFPGAESPYGMVQWSPDTSPNRNAGGGYGFSDTTLIGYSLTHVSGAGCPAAGDVPILPVTSAIPSGTNPNSVTTPFSHTNEVAQAGYYSAQSNGSTSPITSEFTATQHSSMGQFTFPQGSNAGFDIKLQDGQMPTTADSATIVGNDEVRGSVTSGNFCYEYNNDGQPQSYTMYFDIKFSEPFTSSQVITLPGQTRPAGVYVSFDTTSNPVVQAKVGISYVSAADAQQNWQTENPGWDFNAVKAADQASWNNLLGEIQVSGGTYASTQQFYSLLYKDFIQPNVTSDVNGSFMGADEKVHTLAPGQQNQYGMYSGWDIYHTSAQLQAMLDPTAAGDQAQSQVNYYSEDGVFQQWGYLQANNYIMVGDPEQSIISDYYAFGGTNFDTQTALADMIKEATTVNDARPGEALEQRLGYLPTDGTYGCCNFHGAVSTQLEDDIADFALSNFARSLGDTSDADMLAARANDWENLFNPSNGLLNARTTSGQFVPGVTPTTSDNYVEGNAAEYLWDVPQDYQTLINLLGGNSAALSILEHYLSQPNAKGVYAYLSNEFDLGEQYAPYYAGDPAAAQTAIHSLETTVYTPGPSGLHNNDDLGAMSATDVWQMLGLYPENPGSGTLLLSTPWFEHTQINLPNGKAITINAPNAENEYYAQLLKINGAPDQQLYTTFSDLSQGATLDWTLSPTPTDWGTAPKDAPPSDTSGTTATVAYPSSQTAVVAPGRSTTVTVGAKNATSASQRVDIAVNAPSGITVTPTSASIQVPPHSTATTTLTVTASADMPQNFYSAPVTLTTESDGATQTVSQTVLVTTPGSLMSTYNNVGIAGSNDESTANFDGGGYSYPESALAADGFSPGQNVTVNGVTFTWPASPDGYPDNTIANGQTITVNAASGTQTLAFLAAAMNGPLLAAPLTLHYSDGSSSAFYLGLSDWTLNGGSRTTTSYGNLIAASMSYRNCPQCTSTNGQQAVKTDVFYTAVPVDPTKTLTSVTLPNGSGSSVEHIFSIGTSASAMTGPVITSLSTASAQAGQQVTINGSGFGASQGTGYVSFANSGTSWGAPGNTAAFTVNSWSDTAITFTVPTPVLRGTLASVNVTNSSGQTSDTPVLAITPTANPADYYDNAGISNDTTTSCAVFGGGYSYSAQALAAAGLTPGATVNVAGLTFTWPNVAACSPDNILAAGQTMLVNGTSGASTLGLLESSSNGSSSGPITITYTDGTSTTETLSSSDWAHGPGTDETTVATMSYRNFVNGGSQKITMYVYAATLPITSSKTVASVTFPNISNTSASATAMHIFAVATG